MENKNIIDQAFITAAGLGERMRPLTDECCKPMVIVQDKPIIGHVLDKLRAAGVRRIGVNSFYKPEGLEAYLQQYARQYPELTLTAVREDTLLDTGGGIKNGLSTILSDRPFYIVSGDSYWEDAAGHSVLKDMAQAFNPATMDMMLLLRNLSSMTITKGSGDYDISANGQIVRSLNQSGQYTWTSVRIIKNNSLFKGTPEGPFSFRILMDEAEKSGRLYGHIHQAEWHHFSTPADVEAVNRLQREKDCA